jgi:hypothetical protein
VSLGTSPIKPTLSAPVQAELDRLGLDLEHMGKNSKKSARINPNYKTEDAAGESVRVFGGLVGKPGRQTEGMGIDAEATAKEYGAELDAALSEIIDAPDYEAFEDDETRARYLEMLITNIHKRHMNPVRRDARFEQQDREKRVAERLQRMSSGTERIKNFKL